MTHRTICLFFKFTFMTYNYVLFRHNKANCSLIILVKVSEKSGQIFFLCKAFTLYKSGLIFKYVLLTFHKRQHKINDFIDSSTFKDALVNMAYWNAAERMQYGVKTRQGFLFFND